METVETINVSLEEIPGIAYTQVTTIAVPKEIPLGKDRKEFKENLNTIGKILNLDLMAEEITPYRIQVQVYPLDGFTKAPYIFDYINFFLIYEVPPYSQDNEAVFVRGFASARFGLVVH